MSALLLPGSENRNGKFQGRPLSRLGIGVLTVVVPYAVAQVVVELAVGRLDGTTENLARPVGQLGVALTVVMFYARYFRSIERNVLFEFEWARATRQVLIGVMSTILVASVVIVPLLIRNNLRLASGEGLMLLPTAISAALMSSIAEEIAFRGLLFRLTELRFGSLIAVAISSLLFGLLHYVNPGATIFSALAVGVEAGVLLCAVYIVTRQLWMCVAIHFTWNFLTGVINVQLGDRSTTGVLSPSLRGPTWLTGGEFGLEFSAVTVAVGFAIGAVLLVVARQRGLLRGRSRN